MALPGVGALQDALTETNRLLGLVLAELQQTNNTQLDEIAGQLRDLNRRLNGDTG
jgi:hypothetical protein